MPTSQFEPERKASRLGIILAIAASLAACNTSFHPKACNTDDDCGNGLVCVSEDGKAVCSDPAAAPLRIGMSVPLSGPSQALGIGMKTGVDLAFNDQNANGGIRNRKLVLQVLDDEYQPTLAETNAHQLLDVKVGSASPRCPSTGTPAVMGQMPVATTELDRGPNAVLAILGNVGTPTMVRTAPIAVETQTLFFGAFTGASKILRDGLAGPCHKYIFNVRASYANEARATLEYFLKEGVADYAHLVSFDQNDSFGQAGYDGLVTAWKAIKTSFAPPPADMTNPIARFRYTRDDVSSVPAQVTATIAYISKLLTGDMNKHTVGILMTDTYGPAASYIQGLRDWQFGPGAQDKTLDTANRLTLLFSNVSFVGPNALSDRLKSLGTVTTPHGPMSYADGILVSQVVPNYENDTSDVVADYKRLTQAAGVDLGFTALEGYVAARIFIAGLLAHKGQFTSDALVSTFENLPNLSLGLGASSGFSSESAANPSGHNYSKSVWGTAMNPDGTFRNRYFWSDGIPIQLFE